jgi:fumarate reductase subunit C
MSHHRHAAQPYIRPMQGWWHRDPFFVRYMGREATSLAVLVYAVILAVGLVRLSQGEAAWNGWLAALGSPWSILLHVVLLASMAIHAHSWFEIMPKTMPMLYLGGERVSAPAIQRTGWIAAVIVTIGILALTAWWPR